MCVLEGVHTCACAGTPEEYIGVLLLLLSLSLRQALSLSPGSCFLQETASLKGLVTLSPPRGGLSGC